MSATSTSTDLRQSLGHYVAMLRRRWRWATLAFIAVPVLLVGLASMRPDTYQASARVLLADSAAQDAIDLRFVNNNSLDRELANEINVAQSDEAVDRMRASLGLDADAPIPRATISADAGSDALRFRVRSTDPAEAARLANLWADTYVAVKQEDAAASITSTVDRLAETLEDLRLQRRELRADLEALEDRLVAASEDDRASLQLQVDREESAISGELNLIDAQIESNIDSITTLQLNGELAEAGTARVFQRATVPSTPIGVPATRLAAIGIVLGALAAFAAALVADGLDQSVSSLDDVHALGLVGLAAIPRATRKERGGELAVVCVTDPTSPVSDGYQKLRTALQFSAVGRERRTLLVTSPSQGDGKTTTSVNIALAFASVGRHVAIADLDQRRPRLHRVLDAPLSPGITDSLADELPLTEFPIVQPVDPATLVGFTAGTQLPNPAAFLSSPQFTDFVDQLASASELVVFDSPPVLPVADAVGVAPLVDAVVLVVAAGSTTRDELRAAADSIERAGGDLLGVVVVGAGEGGRYTYEADDDRAVNDDHTTGGTQPRGRLRRSG